MRMLADAPEEQRRAMLKSRFEMFAAMPEDQRLNGMAEMITALTRFPPDKRKRLIRTRNLVIAEFPPSTRETIMKARIQLGMKLPKDVNDTDMATMMETLPELPEDLRATFVGSLKKGFETLGMAPPQMPGMAPLSPTPKQVQAPSPAESVDIIKAQEDMMRKLAAASEEMRTAAVKGRFEEILRGSDESVENSVKVLLQAISKLPDDQRRALIRTRTQVIGALSEEQIRRLLRARAIAGKEIQSIENEDKMIAAEELPWVPAIERGRFMNTMTAFIKSMNMPPPPMPSTPVHHAKPMQKKGIFSKSWKCETCGRGFPAK